MPVWSRDGKELYFIAPDGQMMAVAIERKGGNLDIGTPKALFPSNIAATSNFVSSTYRKMDDFLMPQLDDVSGSKLTLLVNWQSSVNK